MQEEKAPSDIVQVIVTLKRPPSATLTRLNRSERFKALKASSTLLREHLVGWLKKEGLFDQVERIGSASTFNLLFVRSSREVAEKMRMAPGVEKVSLVEPSEAEEAKLGGKEDKNEGKDGSDVPPSTEPANEQDN